MECEVLYSDEFGMWWESPSIAEQESVARDVEILRERGIDLRFPLTSSVRQSRHSHMRELEKENHG